MNLLWIRMALLAACVLPAARAEFQLLAVTASGEQAVPPMYNLGVVFAGDTVQARFRLRNMAAAPAVLSYLEVRGTGFGPRNPLALPVTVEARAAVDFTVTFSAPDPGTYSAALDSEGITVILTAAVPVAPPLPPPRLAVVLAPPRSAQQGELLVALDAPSPRLASGTVTLDFQPRPPGALDPAIVFSSGTRAAGFTCDPGQTQCRFAGQPAALFQTGSTAGVLTFTARLGGASTQTAVTIAAAPVSVTAIQGSRSPGSLEITITGFDNARTAAGLAFTFFDAAGAAIAPGAIRTDAADAFQQLYRTSDAGGAFQLRAVFPVTGDASQVAAFEAAISNSEGATVAARTKF